MFKLATRNTAAPETLPRCNASTSAWSTLKGTLLAAAVVGSALIPSLASALSLSPSSPPFSLGSASAYFVKDVPYGSDARHKFDIFTPKANSSSKSKTPLVIFIHGGGFSSGSKEKAYSRSNQKMIVELLKQGVAFASINYPLLGRNDTVGLIKSLRGAQRSVQFMKHHHGSFNIDPQKVIAIGSSAGASTALWLAFHDDMANLNSGDPVEHQSTRILAAVGSEAQSSMDVLRWEEVFKQYNFSASSMESAVKNFYGISQLHQLYSSSTVAYRQDVDLLGLMDASDPEVWVANQSVPVTKPSSVGILYHHPYHAKALRDQAQKVGLQGNYYIPQMNIMPSPQESMTDFILRKVK